MGLGTFLVFLALMLSALYVYRSRLTKPPATFESLTAASIHTIEAAFIRAGASGVADLRSAAERCGRALIGSLDPSEIERDAARRGLVFAPEIQRAMYRVRVTLAIVSALAALAATFIDAHHAGAAPLRRVLAEFAWLYVTALAGIFMVGYLGTSTARGRQALAMRRAAYPLRLLNAVDPAEAVALYGGSVQRRSDGKAVATAGADGGGEYVWVGGGDCGHADGGGHDASSHSCGGSSCGSH